MSPSATEYYFETDVFFMISLREIMKNTSVSNFYLEVMPNIRSCVKSILMPLHPKLFF